MKIGILPNGDDAIKAANELFKGLLEKGVVEELMAPAVQPGGSCSLALFADAERLDAILPWAPVMPVQGGRALSKLAFTDPGVKTGVVLRPCEARASVELIKLKQIVPENILFITVDCPGTCEVAAYKESGVDEVEGAKELISGKVPEGNNLRTACSICENPAAEVGEIRLHIFGGGEVAIEAEDEVAVKLEEAGVVTFSGAGIAGRDEAVKALKAERIKARDELFTKFDAETGSLEKLKEAFSTCIRCYNCMENCPICYCKVCIFKSPTFEHTGDKYAAWAMRKGVQKLPTETMLFHMTRLNHMSSSCIGCGVCDTACPMGLPVATLFRKVAKGVQEMFEYQPGRSLDDDIPLSVFREDELQAESGSGK